MDQSCVVGIKRVRPASIPITRKSDEFAELAIKSQAKLKCGVFVCVELQQLINKQHRHAVDGPMFQHQHEFTPLHRQLCVDAFIDLQLRYNLEPSVFFLAVNIFDRCIASCRIDLGAIELVTLSSVALATRYVQDEIVDYYCTACKSPRYALTPRICGVCKQVLSMSTTINQNGSKYWFASDLYRKFEEDSLHRYKQKCMLDMELKIASALGFDLGAVTAYDIAMEILKSTPHLVKHTMKLLRFAMLSTDMCHHSPLHIAQAAIYMAQRVPNVPALQSVEFALNDLRNAEVAAMQYKYASRLA